MPVNTVGPAKLIQVVGRYALYDAIGSGGMASVHLALLLGPVGFTRTVAIKRLHPQFAADPEFVSMFLDEARLAARIRHPNVVQTLDVVASDGGLFLVMDLVQGETLARLIRSAVCRSEKIPVKIVGGIMAGVLHGLHAAHEARGAGGEALELVHRDISPQNVLVGIDGLARVLDFGVAKAVGRVQQTQVGQLKGKLSYMAPEQLLGKISRATDIYAASVVLWEALTSCRLFDGEDQATVLSKLMARAIVPPSTLTPGLSKEVDALVLRGLASDPTDRFATAREMALAIEAAFGLAPPSEVGQWTENLAHETLHNRLRRMAEIESAEIDSISIPYVLIDDRAAKEPPKTKDARHDLAVPHFRPKEPPDVRVVPTGTRQSSRKDLGRLVAGAGLSLLLGGGVGGAITCSHRAPAARSPTVERAPFPFESSRPPVDTPRSEPAKQATDLVVDLDDDVPPLPAKPEPRRRPPPRAPRAAKVSIANGENITRVSIPAADCSTPYTIDADGIRHPRRECM
jgi:serine/threonine protein kinase